MLYFTRWKALAIILTALVVCLCAVPNFFPEARVKTWPLWAQRHLVLGLDLQGGSYLLLEVDSGYVKKEKLDQVRDDVRRVLREAKIGYTGLNTRNDAVEVRISRDTDFQNALSKLRDLSQPLGGLLGALRSGPDRGLPARPARTARPWHGIPSRQSYRHRVLYVAFSANVRLGRHAVSGNARARLFPVARSPGELGGTASVA